MEAEVRALLKKYDHDHTGVLEPDQIKMLLTDMDEGGKGVPPTDSELK